jgi:hypothetical protein
VSAGVTAWLPAGCRVGWVGGRRRCQPRRPLTLQHHQALIVALRARGGWLVVDGRAHVADALHVRLVLRARLHAGGRGAARRLGVTVRRGRDTCRARARRPAAPHAVVTRTSTARRCLLAHGCALRPRSMLAKWARLGYVPVRGARACCSRRSTAAAAALRLRVDDTTSRAVAEPRVKKCLRCALGRGANGAAVARGSGGCGVPHSRGARKNRRTNSHTATV